jgi:type IV pilus assembly protein PilC
MSDILIIDENNKKSQKKESHKPERKSARNKLDELNDFFIGLQKVKTKDKVIFYRLLATMTNAGMSILKSVSVLEKQEKNPILKKMLQTFVTELRSGKNFSECLELFPNTFEEAEIGIVKSGEKT